MSTTFTTVSETSDIECAICLEVWTDPVELVPCRHIYCRGCIQGLRRTRCPDCRRDFTSTAKPNRILCNMAKEVTVQCDGCQWEGTREQSEHHRCTAQPRAEPVQAWTPPSREELHQRAHTAAHQGQTPPLRQGWGEAVDQRNGRTYYVNHMSRQTTWTPPIDASAPAPDPSTPLPEGWEMKWDSTANMHYYVDHVHKRTSWTRPY